jgi:hypothetical protein
VVSLLLLRSVHYTSTPEKYHSTPETQTDESYNHPEDVEHFSQHQAIEKVEAEREAKFQGISTEEFFKHVKEAEEEAKRKITKPIVRIPPPEKMDPATRFKDAKSKGELKGEWGSGEAGYKAPVDASDKLRLVYILRSRCCADLVHPVRRNLPYKVCCFRRSYFTTSERPFQYKFRRNWGDF